jgi:hypothetical protein
MSVTNIFYRDLEPNNWSISGDVFVVVGLETGPQSGNDYCILDPIGLNNNGGGPNTAISQGQLMSSVLMQDTTQPLQAASDFAASAWTGLGWDLSSFDNFKTQVQSWVLLQFSNIPNLNLYILNATIQGTQYLVPIIYTGNNGTQLSHPVPAYSPFAGTPNTAWGTGGRINYTASGSGVINLALPAPSGGIIAMENTNGSGVNGAPPNAPPGVQAINFQVYDSSGNLLNSFSPNPAGLDFVNNWVNIQSFTVGSDGNVYVLGNYAISIDSFGDWQAANSFVYACDLNGNPLSGFGTNGLAFQSYGAVWVANVIAEYNGIVYQGGYRQNADTSIDLVFATLNADGSANTLQAPFSMQAGQVSSPFSIYWSPRFYVGSQGWYGSAAVVQNNTGANLQYVLNSPTIGGQIYSLEVGASGLMVTDYYVTSTGYMTLVSNTGNFYVYDPTLSVNYESTVLPSNVFPKFVPLSLDTFIVVYSNFDFSDLKYYMTKVQVLNNASHVVQVVTSFGTSGTIYPILPPGYISGDTVYYATSQMTSYGDTIFVHGQEVTPSSVQTLFIMQLQ